MNGKKIIHRILPKTGTAAMSHSSAVRTRRPAALASFGLTAVLSLGLAFSPVTGVNAETYYGDPDWHVAFTSEEKMDSNFHTSDLDEAIRGLQPGDNAIITLALENRHQETTDWYMTNEVLYSLEDRSANAATEGGAYTYRLTYTDKNGEVTVLFDSDTVGGDTISEAGEGLHEATDALAEYFYLDTLVQGQSGTITLEVALDGETQGNDYQDTLADLQMNFAVELSHTTPGTPTTTDRPHTGDGSNPSNPVKTGDETNLLLIFGIMGGSGLVLLILAIVCVRRNRRVREDVEGGREE